MIRAVLLINCLLLLAVISFKPKAAEIDGVDFEITAVSDNVYIIGQSYGMTKINFGVVVGNNEVAVITSMMRKYAPTIEKLIKTITNKPIRYVFNIDSDRYQHDANEYFASKGATIISQKNLRNTKAYTQVTFEQELSLDVGGEWLVAYHTKAHSTDNAIVFIKQSNVIFMGDAFRNDWLMYSGPNGSDSHVDGLNVAIELSNKQTKFVPGNRKSSPFSNLNEIKKAKELHIEFSKKVKELQRQGLDIEAISRSNEIHRMVNHLERYEEFKPYIIDYVKEIFDYG